MLKELILVGFGGGFGSMFRFITSKIVSQLVQKDFEFLGTLAANVLGCFLIGLFAGCLLSKNLESESLRLLLIIGFCGGYTTFSTFSYENFNFIEANQWMLLIMYVGLSIFLGLAAVWTGVKIGNTI